MFIALITISCHLKLSFAQATSSRPISVKSFSATSSYLRLSSWIERWYLISISLSRNLIGNSWGRTESSSQAWVYFYLTVFVLSDCFILRIVFVMFMCVQASWRLGDMQREYTRKNIFSLYHSYEHVSTRVKAYIKKSRWSRLIRYLWIFDYRFAVLSHSLYIAYNTNKT